IQPFSTWHHKLGHPSSKIIKHLTNSHHIPIKISSSTNCISCHCAKSHKLPFSYHSLSSKRPLKLIYSDVWDLAPVKSLDGFLYYLIFVDHYSKYVWLYQMKNKSHVFSIFIRFKALVENILTYLLFLYSLTTVSFFSTHGISHLSSPPHTPELNGTAKRRYRHMVETGRTLHHHALLPSNL
ncbi:hypothetical protein CR513_37820, partial [Mucuna pruriens]